MGTIKTLIDLTEKLINNVKYRQFSAEIAKIQSLISALQSEQLETTEKITKISNDNIDLKSENHELKLENSKLKQVISDLQDEDVFESGN